ncbi:MAG: tRNA 2-selenouridine synthase [Thermoanaerobacterales bacterium 50_218]|nr:MAG: tRNA 2-selenouridine synthase [Thermoanaerobacterales bacterium 50_218]HAA89544.1 tRNA 2-selenouridine(34) synthase MnmH [Peptococcaceae bacterium]
MEKAITVEELLKKPDAVLVDVRTRSEYREGTIPRAINLPLFDEAERSELGILYKMSGPEEARFRGLSLVSPKLDQLVEALRPYYGRELVLFCWRGGLRSQSLTSVLNLVGFKAYYLVGGYKAYRRFVLSYLSGYNYEKKVFVVLCGLTGVGKTEVIRKLRELGEPAIDLEELAGHRGSVFGHIGINEKRSQKNFDALLAGELRRFAEEKYLIVECESRRIGNIFLPPGFFQAMQRGLRILLYDDHENRIRRLERTYLSADCGNSSCLEEAILHLQKHLGKRKVKLLLDYLESKDYRKAIDFLLREYYDPLYHFPEHPSSEYQFSVKTDDPERAAQEIRNYLKNFFEEARGEKFP